MEQIIEFFRHFDVWLQNTVTEYGPLTYGFLFAIVFAETGLVFTPFLPGDSLLFAVGAFAARPQAPLNIAVLYPLFLSAALIGDQVNYWAGRLLGRRLFQGNSRFLKKEYLLRTEAFFERHGGKAIIMARFVPIVRTFAPFVAGMGNWNYGRFLGYSVAGAVLWVGVCVTAGYLLGNLEPVKHHFEKFVLLIIIVSVLPAVVEIVQHKRNSHRETAVVKE